MTSKAIEQVPGPKELARFMDHVLLKPDASKEDIAAACAQAREFGIGAICVNTSRVLEACHLLEDSAVKVIAAIAFPLGAMDSDAKRYETEVAVDHGAHFIEAVANIGRAKDEDYAYIERELRDIVDAADERPVGLIIEAPLLGREELRALCGLAVECGLKSIVTSTGFDGCDAQVEDIRFIREIVGEQFGIKANGGIRDEASALAMIEAGATRVGAAEVTNILKH